MTMQFTKAKKSQAKLRLALTGPAGSGKTKTALLVGTHMGKRLAVIDSERDSATLYADEVAFETLNLPDHEPETYIEAIKVAASGGFDVLIIDGISPAWERLKDRVDSIAKAKYRGNSWSAWSELTPIQNALIEAILTYPGHVFCCMRTKTAWEVEKDDKSGKSKPVKVGLAPIQREGVDYEFSIVMDMSEGGTAHVSKTRWSDISDKVIQKPGKAFAEGLLAWLNSGAAAEPSKPFAPSVPIVAQAERGEDKAATDTRRNILLEKIEAAMVAAWPGKAAEAQRAKIDTLQAVFGTTSWTEVKGTHPDILAVKLEALHRTIRAKTIRAKTGVAQAQPPAVQAQAPPIQMSVSVEADIPERDGEHGDAFEPAQ